MKVVIVTPTRDRHVSAEYHASQWQMMQRPELFGHIHQRVFLDADLVRARSRGVRTFLQETQGSHLLFWDGDVGARPVVLPRMLEAGVGCIAATYPKKHRRGGKCADFAYNTDGMRVEFAGERAAVASVGCGFMLLERGLLQRMTDRYAGELLADDEGQQTVMLFAMQFGNRADGTRVLWPEDYSFCNRVREMGERVWLYTGPGSPLPHVGSDVFEGAPEDVHPVG